MSIVLLVGFGIGIMLYALLRGIEAVVKSQLDLSRSWLVWVDPDGRNARVERRKIRGNRIRPHRKAEEIVHLDGGATYSTDKGPLRIIDRTNGWNLIAPTQAQAVGDNKVMQWLQIANPRMGWYMARHNLGSQAMRSGEENLSDHWIVKVAPWAFGMIFVTFLVVAFLAYKIMQATSAGA
jgi:hypothetical protein